MRLAVSALIVLSLAACGNNDGSVGKDDLPSVPTGCATPTTAAVGATDPAAPTPAATPDAAATELTVFAATSLKRSFAEIGDTFARVHPGAKVTFSFAGSQLLATQVLQGAPADVIATADQGTIDKVVAELKAPAVVFAANRLAIATERDNPLGIAGLADLAKPSTKVVLGNDEVPVGKAAKKALAAAGVTVKPVSQEPDVGKVLSKVTLGEADAGIVYVTDVQGAQGKVCGIDLPGVSNVYPIGVLKGARHAAAAAAFVAFVQGPQGQSVLQRNGFTPVS